MFITGLSALLASLLYLLASRLIWQKIQGNSDTNIRPKVIKLALMATLVHAFALSSTLWGDQAIHFNMGNGLSLVALLASAILLVTCINKNTEILGIFVYPIAALTVLLPVFMNDFTPLPLTLGIHVLISIAAYSIMGIATAQAILYGRQECLFRKKKLSRLMKALPPLQVMENTLIQLVIIGFIFLSFALLSGAFFIEDIFAQHLIHKTFLAILSWLVYGAFLFGHFKYGWRGRKAARYTIWAYVLLVLSFVGTSIILSSLGY
ncbi:MAG: cytochrome c biogenesis protein CcsA [Thiomicrorhabdus sp.]|nr:cytochrome c biogenesis protein CcsA [Thiomicrorhabdus sp.]